MNRPIDIKTIDDHGIERFIKGTIVSRKVVPVGKASLNDGPDINTMESTMIIIGDEPVTDCPYGNNITIVPNTRGGSPRPRTALDTEFDGYPGPEEYAISYTYWYERF